MSSHLHSYLGPYVECAHRKPKQREIEVNGCPDSRCPAYQKHSNGPAGTHHTRFCALCGKAIAHLKKVVDEDPVRAYSLIGDELFTMGEADEDGVFALGSNLSNPPTAGAGLGEDESHLDLSCVDMVGEMAWFEDKYAKELAALRQAYDDVTVKWGFHQYWM